MNYIITQIACLFLAEIIYLTSAQCRKCDQTITGRNFMYSRALDIIQNEEYLDLSDFDEIRYKRKLKSVLSVSLTDSSLIHLLIYTQLVRFLNCFFFRKLFIANIWSFFNCWINYQELILKKPRNYFPNLQKITWKIYFHRLEQF